MSQSERIRYIITGYYFTGITSGKGSIEYQLTDDFGNERNVTAMANLNIFKKIRSVRPIYHRELPLVKALANATLNQSIIVDFSEFNNTHPRGSTRKQKISIPSVVVKHSYNGSIESFGSLFDNKIRLIQLMLITLICFGFLSYFL